MIKKEKRVYMKTKGRKANKTERKILWKWEKKKFWRMTN